MVDYSINSDGIAVITLNNPGSVNVINRDFIDAYEQAIDKVVEEQGLKGVIVASAKKDFMVGGDLQLLLAAKDAARPVPETTVPSVPALTGVEKLLPATPTKV